MSVALVVWLATFDAWADAELSRLPTHAEAVAAVDFGETFRHRAWEYRRLCQLEHEKWFWDAVIREDADCLRFWQAVANARDETRRHERLNWLFVVRCSIPEGDYHAARWPSPVSLRHFRRD